MTTREKGGRVVFIGNIPYGVSEEMIMEIFSSCGKVMNFRLVYDKETGQPKGFGFLEYSDTDSAQSAIRNLNEYELNGRTLRVDFSNDNRATKSEGQSNNNNTNTNNANASQSNRAPPPAHFDAAAPPGARPDSAALPQLPPGLQLPPGVSAFDAISKTIAQTSTPDLLDFISQLKAICASNPAQATALLASSPQLGYAVFQAMLLLNLVDTNIVQSLVVHQAPAPAPPAPVPQQPLPQQLPQPPPGYPPQHPPGYPPQVPAGYPPQPPAGYPAPQPQYNPQAYAPTPPVQQPAYQAPPQQQAPPPAAAPDQAALYQQVLGLTREQIFALPAEARGQIIAIRQQLGAPV